MTTRRRYLRDWATDVLQSVTGRRDPELPPVRYRRVGAGDFRETGTWLAALLVRNGLQPQHRVLDIGCGIGRVALALTPILSAEGSYDGFDADRRAVRWCADHFTPRHPRFRFTHADVAAGQYNRGVARPTAYPFPWPDATFDFAFATSVFTHLEMESARHYFAEAQRVLRPGGILCATVFVLDGSATKLQFPVERDGAWLMDAQRPTRGVAFRQETLDALLSQWTDVRVQRGNWRETGSFSVRGQDVLTARTR
jgi:SAM-dependent methyltransferase